MMRRYAAAAIAVLVVLATSTATAKVVATWKRDAHGSTATSGLAIVKPDLHMLRHDWQALRIKDSAGTNIPWRVLNTARGVGRLKSVITVIPRNSGTTNRGAVAEFQIPGSYDEHSSLNIGLTPGGDAAFVETATIEGSNDARAWRVFARGTVVAVAPTAESPNTTRTASFTISYPPTDFRYVRVSVPHASSIDSLEVNSTDPQVDVPGTYDDLEVSTATRKVVGGDDLIAFAADGVLPDRIEVGTTAESFERPYTVVTAPKAEELKDAVPLFSGVLYRHSPTLTGGGASSTVAQLPDLSSELERFIGIRIENGDDPPLEHLRALLIARSPRLLLKVPKGTSKVTLSYGRSDLGSPNYEFARLPLPEDANSAPIWALSPHQIVRVNIDPEKDRNRYLVNIAVVLLGLAAAGAALRVMRRQPRGN